MINLELLVQGLVQGCIYALIAIGLTLVYGLLRILHIAHAAVFTMGGYCGVLTTNATGSFGLGLATSAIVVGLFGVLFYRLVYQPIIRQPPHVPLIASIGVFIVMQEGYRILFGPLTISFIHPPLQEVSAVLGVRLRHAELVVVAATVLLIGLLSLLSTQTRLGIAWRATVSNPAIAESFGVNLTSVRAINFFVASALAAAAGVMVALLGNMVFPTMGAVPAYKALAVIVLGGLGNVRGTLFAALLLGVIEAYGTIYLGKLVDRDGIAFAFLIAVLMFRPHGMFGAKGS
jgi:branched-chain amino acid transport system permease protein